MTCSGACWLVAALVVMGCERKAPGPEECERFALRVVGASPETAARLPGIKDAVDELTVRCLTTPFSRSLLSCVEQVPDARYCFARHGVRLSAPPEPRETPFFDPEL